MPTVLVLPDGREGLSFLKMPRRFANEIKWEMDVKIMMCLRVTRSLI